MTSRLIGIVALFLITGQVRGQEVVYPVGVTNQRPSIALPNPNGYRVVNGFREEGHTGVDLANGTVGGTVRAIGAGTVTQVCEGWCYGFGNVAIIRHNLSGGPFYSLYAHMLDGSLLVAAGDAVSVGQKIGEVGNTGNSTGPHLHFAIKTRDQLGCGYIIAGSCNSEWGQEAIYQDPLEFVAVRRAGPGPFNYDEAVSGDIAVTRTPDGLTGPTFQFGVGRNTIRGSQVFQFIPSEPIGTFPITDWDFFFFEIPPERILVSASITFSNAQVLWGDVGSIGYSRCYLTEARVGFAANQGAVIAAQGPGPGEGFTVPWCADALNGRFGASTAILWPEALPLTSGSYGFAHNLVIGPLSQIPGALYGGRWRYELVFEVR